jgi:hypothetical protein
VHNYIAAAAASTAEVLLLTIIKKKRKCSGGEGGIEYRVGKKDDDMNEISAWMTPPGKL